MTYRCRYIILKNFCIQVSSRKICTECRNLLDVLSTSLFLFLPRTTERYHPIIRPDFRTEENDLSRSNSTWRSMLKYTTLTRFVVRGNDILFTPKPRSSEIFSMDRRPAPLFHKFPPFHKRTLSNTIWNKESPEKVYRWKGRSVRSKDA